jgi:thiol-disulfide isomerase/thioredoxin
METFPSNMAGEAERPRAAFLFWMGALAGWAVLVFGQYFCRQHSPAPSSHFFWNNLWPFASPGPSFWRFAAGEFLGDLGLAVLVQLGARMMGSRVSFRKTAPAWFLLSASFGVLLALTSSHRWLAWSLRVLKWTAYSVILKRLYQISWSHTLGSWVLAGSFAGGVLVCFGIVRAMPLLKNLPWESLLETSRLHPIDRPADLNWTLRSRQGQRLLLEDRRGKYLFINAWATWCTPCLLELPSLQRLYQHYRSNPNIDFFFVSEESPSVIEFFLKKHPYALPFYTAARRPASFTSSGIPVSFLVSPKGRIIAMEEGSARWDTPTMYETIDRLLAESETSAAAPRSSKQRPADHAAAERLYQEGISLSGKKKYSEAETLLNRVLFLRKDAAQDMDFVSVLYELGNVHYQQYHWATAETYYKQALILAQQLLKPGDPSLANYFNALGCADYSQGLIAVAEVLHAKAVNLAKDGLPSNEQAMFLHNYAKDLRLINRMDEANAADRKAAKLEKHL